MIPRFCKHNFLEVDELPFGSLVRWSSLSYPSTKGHDGLSFRQACKGSSNMGHNESDETRTRWIRGG